MRNGALHPGEAFPTHPAPQVAQEVQSFWTYRPLTARQARTAKWLGVVVVLLVAIAFAGLATDGRFGLVGVVGGSIARYFPQGSTVVTLPLPPREGSFVVARAGAPDTTEDVEAADVKSQLVVKQYKNGKLVSSDDGNVYSTFEYRGRVWFHLHTEKVFWWRDTGMQKAVIGPPTVDQQLGAAGASINTKASERKRLREQVAGAVKVANVSSKEMVDGDLSTALSLGRDQTATAEVSGIAKSLIIWMTGDDNLEVNGQIVDPNPQGFVSVTLACPANRVCFKCVASAPCAPPGILIREVVLKP